jgi:F-type H+-transporting ATPase subunit epsilon
MASFVIDIVTPEKSVLKDEEIYVVVIPAGKGYLSAMTGHIPLLTILKPGIVEFLGKKRSSQFFVSGGFVEILPEKVTVIAEKVETVEEMDIEKVKSLMKDVEERLKSASSSDKEVFIQYEEATSKLYLLEKHHFVL